MVHLLFSSCSAWKRWCVKAKPPVGMPTGGFGIRKATRAGCALRLSPRSGSDHRHTGAKPVPIRIIGIRVIVALNTEALPTRRHRRDSAGETNAASRIQCHGRFLLVLHHATVFLSCRITTGLASAVSARKYLVPTNGSR